jgi:hypothetical protein
MLLGWMLLESVNLSGWRAHSIVTFAADTLKLDGLPDDPRQFRAAVDQVIKKVDTLIEQLRAKPGGQAIVLDLLQTRDDILRELPKIDGAPGDAKWTQKEMRESVQDKLRLLKGQYDKALESTS